jgi:tetratricopeptide (TPR) repeat protein
MNSQFHPNLTDRPYTHSSNSSPFLQETTVYPELSQRVYVLHRRMQSQNSENDLNKCCIDLDYIGSVLIFSSADCRKDLSSHLQMYQDPFFNRIITIANAPRELEVRDPEDVKLQLFPESCFLAYIFAKYHYHLALRHPEKLISHSIEALKLLEIPVQRRWGTSQSFQVFIASQIGMYHLMPNDPAFMRRSSTILSYLTALLQKGELGEAMKLLQDAAQGISKLNDFQKRRVHSLASVLYVLTHQLDQSTNHSLLALEGDDCDVLALAHSSQSLCQFLKGNREEASRHVKVALSKQPNSPFGNVVAYIVFGNTSYIDKAYTYALPHNRIVDLTLQSVKDYLFIYPSSSL